MQVTDIYVKGRFSDFVTRYATVLNELRFDAEQVDQMTDHLKQRLDSHDFRVYGSRPIHRLHGGKRITRYLIKLAIETCPAARARKAALSKDYERRAAEIRKSNPHACLFSFEAAYAGQLKCNLRPWRHLFRI